MTGRGRIYWPSGATYEGDIRGGFLHGSGTFYGLEGSVYKGSWRMNIQHGMGTKTYPNSDIYEGLWREGLQEGIGTYTWSNGNTYIGNWKAGKMSGRGLMKWENGDLFDGVWLEGLEHGSGYYKYADGAHYFGTWSRGLKDGRGTFYPVGSKLPKQKFSESVVCNDVDQSRPASLISFEGLRNKPLHKKRCSLDGRNISSYFCRSGRISHRPMSFDGIWNIGDSASSILSQDSSLTLFSSSDDGQHKLQHDNVLIYEREYVQGVLIMERARSSDSGAKHTKKWHHKIRRKQPRGPGEAIHKGHKSYYLMLNLQLGIRYASP